METSVSEGGNVVPFSCASVIVGVAKEKVSSGAGSAVNSSTTTTTSSEILKLFKYLPNDSLLSNGGRDKVPLSSAFAKVDLILLYASAHWCPPCRRYTPQLVQFYNDAKKIYKSDPKRTTSIEIVFVSSDHDINEFGKYYATMPWLAVQFDSDTRERLLSWMNVSSIPRLMCLDGRSGKVLETNSVGRALDLARFSKFVK